MHIYIYTYISLDQRDDHYARNKHKIVKLTVNNRICEWRFHNFVNISTSADGRSNHRRHKHNNNWRLLSSCRKRYFFARHTFVRFQVSIL